MEWVKTTAKTLPEAIDLALDNLGVDESEAEIVVLEEPRQGLFGRMRGTARVEARVKPKAIRPKTERNRNRKGRSEGGGNRAKGGGDKGKNRSRNRSGGQGGNRNGGGRGEKSDGRQSGSQQDSDSPSDSRSDSQSAKSETRSGGGSGGKNADQRDRNRGGGNRGGGDRGKGGGGRGRGDQQDRSRQSKGRNSNNEHEAKPKEETPVDEVADHLQTFLSGLTEAFGFDSPVSVDSSEPDVLIGRIEGQHGLLVGPKGRTLDAVQELARISCQRTVPSSIRIKVDVGGYRQQRVEALTAFARKAADSAAEDGNEVALEPMSPADRKAIHDALSDDDRVETRSVGTEPRRKVLVVPLEPAPAAEEDADDELNDRSEDGEGATDVAEDVEASDEASDDAAAGDDEMAPAASADSEE